MNQEHRDPSDDLSYQPTIPNDRKLKNAPFYENPSNDSCQYDQT
jgi:hypothetical protein